MILRGAENEAFFSLVDFLHKELDAHPFALLDLDDAVEVGFLVNLAGFNFAFNDGIVRGVGVFIQRGFDAADFEGRQKTVVDAFLQRIDIDRIAEVFVSVGVFLAFGRGGQTELHGGREIFHDGAPVAFVVGAAAVTLIDNDQVKVIFWVAAKIGGLARPAHKGLEDGEEDASVGGHPAKPADLVGFDAHQGVFGEGVEGVKSLVGQDVAVRQEQHARSSGAIALQVPAAVK